MHKIAVLGLGYVGLPLAVEFAKKYEVVGFDISQSRIDELSRGIDVTLEVEESELKSRLKTFNKSIENHFLTLTGNSEMLADCDIYIVTVPTPIDKYKNPDISPLLKASETVSGVLSKGDIVIYESTVYPGCTEDDCVPVLEKGSGLKFNKDFFCGYSPERVNPGDKNRPIRDIVKITSGSTSDTAKVVDALYSSIITAGTHPVSDIKVAEAAKVIENTQRDINIALMNELAMIFDKMGIRTQEVIEAASTKWNFIKFYPGLVGGHCIGVDPYYLTFKSQAIGYNPDMIISGRRVNDSMGKYIAEKTVKEMIKFPKKIKDSKVLIAGFTFKEDCPDVRNTRVTDICAELREYGMDVDIYDPVADHSQALHDYGMELAKSVGESKYDAVIIAVKHKVFYDMFSPSELLRIFDNGGVLVDVKSMFTGKELPDGIGYWSL